MQQLSPEWLLLPGHLAVLHSVSDARCADARANPEADPEPDAEPDADSETNADSDTSSNTDSDTLSDARSDTHSDDANPDIAAHRRDDFRDAEPHDDVDGLVANDGDGFA
jgi:hypothetical protein